MTTTLIQRSLCRSTYDFQANPSPHLVNDAKLSPIARQLLFAQDTSHVLTLTKPLLSRCRSSPLYFLFDTWLFRVRRIRVDFQSDAPVLFLKWHITLPSCSRDVENNNTSSANRWVESESQPMPSSSQRVKSSSSAACRTFEQQATQRVTLLRTPLHLEDIALFVCQDYRFLVCILSLQEADVLWFDTLSPRIQ